MHVQHRRACARSAWSLPSVDYGGRATLELRENDREPAMEPMWGGTATTQRAKKRILTHYVSGTRHPRNDPSINNDHNSYIAGALLLCTVVPRHVSKRVTL